MPEIWFPNLGITIEHLNRVCFSIFNIPVYWYGVIIMLSFLCGAACSAAEAKRAGINPELIYDFLMFGIIGAIIGARTYYVAFSWDNYRDNLIKVFALREGGLAIYGGIIGGLIVLILFTKIKKISTALFLDIISPGLILGQVIGRWGNFFNREAYGGYTDNIFAMRYLRQTVPDIPKQLLDKLVTINGAEYIQVHPTFLYESLWNLAVFVILLFYRDKKKLNGELTALYFLLYGLGRIWVEGLRTDQLLIGNTNMAVSQILSGIIVVFSICFIIQKRRKVIYK